MNDVQRHHGSIPSTKPSRGSLLTRLAMSRRFQTWASRFPLTRGRARREGEALFDLIAGFVHSQVLCALVELGILEALSDGPRTLAKLSFKSNVPQDRLAVLLRAGAALGLIRTKRRDRFALTVRGATLLGVPGLEGMIRHHAVLARDLADPAAFFRDTPDTELAAFWPYVFGAGAANDPGEVAIYSNLMTDTQALVAEETLRSVNLKGTRALLDVGGGRGAFLSAVGGMYPDIKLALFDLPTVVGGASDVPLLRSFADRLLVHGADFRSDPLPIGADTISLVRVLYDHDDRTVSNLLAKTYRTLPPRGRIVISEPMLSDAKAYPPTDAYFAIYTLAMGTGRTRSPSRIAKMLGDAGFITPRIHRTSRPFITSVVSAIRPESEDSYS